MSRGIWNGAVVAICIALVTESAVAQPAPAPAPGAPAAAPAAPPPPPTAADPAPPPSDAPPAAAAPTYPPPPPPGYAYPPPGYAYPPGYDYRHERRRRPRRSRGMMIAGLVLFGVSYVFPAMVGIAVGSEKRDSCDCKDAYRMLIPVAGPLTLLHGDSDYRAFNGLLVTDAVLQGAGMVLTIFGIMRYIASAREADDYSLEHPRSPWSFDVAPAPGGAYGALRLRL